MPPRPSPTPTGQGCVHRDVKPENILVGDGEAKLVDFGIARIAGEKTLTKTGAVVGTLAYMAPEQADGLRPGPAADVYSLALTLYECFCGEHPLVRESPAATARAIGEPIAPLEAVRLDLPPAMTETIDACLDPDSEARPLASELESVLTRHAADLDGAPLPAIEGPDGEAPLLPRSRPSLTRLAPAAGVAILGIVALAATGAPLPLALAALVPGGLALGRPRPAFAIELALVVLWILIGAGEPGTAVLVAVLGLPLLIPVIDEDGDPPAGPRPAPGPGRSRAGLSGPRGSHPRPGRESHPRRRRLPLAGGVGGARRTRPCCWARPPIRPPTGPGPRARPSATPSPRCSASPCSLPRSSGRPRPRSSRS